MSMHSIARSGGNAPGLPNDSLSRRSALRGSAAAALVLVAGATAAQCPMAPDSAVIDLASRLEALIASEREAWNRRAEAEDAVLRATPPTPIRRKMAEPYAGFDTLSPQDRFAKLFADPTEFWAASAAADAEHKTALAEHARIVAVIERRHGTARLETQVSRLTDQVAMASERLAEMAAASPVGLVAKARVLLALAGNDPLSRLPELERHVALLESMLKDVVRLGAGGLHA